MSILQVIRGYFLRREYGPGGAGMDLVDRRAMEEAYRLRQPNDVLANALGVSEKEVQYWYDHVAPIHWRYGFKVLDLRIRVSRHLANLALKLFAKAQTISPYPFRLKIHTRSDHIGWWDESIGRTRGGLHASFEKAIVVKMSVGANNVIVSRD